MRSLTLVSRNLSRRKGRSVLSSIGLILAIAVIISTFTISQAMEMQVGDEIEKYGPNIVITPKTQSISVPYGNVVTGNVTIPESTIERIQTIPNKANIRILAPKLYGQVQYGGDTILVVGIIPDNEIQLKKWWSITGDFPRNGTNEVVSGSALQSSLNLTVGSTLQTNDASFLVTGTLNETGSVDDYSIFVPLSMAQSMFNIVGQISIIDVGALCKDCPVEIISQQIMDAVPEVRAIPVKQAVETRMKAVEQTASFSLLLASIIMVVGVAGIMNTMLASVHERVKEIGVFVSLGADNSHLYKMFIFESIFLGLIGGLIGTLAGFFSSMLLGPLFINVPINPANTPLHLIPVVIGLSVSACVVASLYPTWRASRIDPVKALKTV
ncbi:MAG TPA: FtsX-like permease family protein [Candidatus Bathyarchaeia archaeon]